MRYINTRLLLLLLLLPVLPELSSFWSLLELRVMWVVVATGTINRCAKLQSNRYHQQTIIQFITGQMSFLQSSHSFTDKKFQDFLRTFQDPH